MSGLTRSYPAQLAVPSGGVIRGEVEPPPSKSVTQRYFNLALLAEQPTVVERPLLSEDTELFLGALKRCGFGVSRGEEEVRLDPPRERRSSPVTIECGNGGTMYRFLLAALASREGEWILDGSERLRERPIAPLVEALRHLGAKLEYVRREGGAPIRIVGGHLAGGRVEVAAAESSQYLSALLMAAHKAQSSVEVVVCGLSSAPYVDLTLDAIRRFGGQVEVEGDGYRVRPQALRGGRHQVEADYSAAAYPAAAAVITGGSVLLRGLEPSSAQGDRGFLTVLERIGARIETAEEGVRVTAAQELLPVTANLESMPDQVPTLAALAAFCRGTTRITNVAHLRFKESDRLAAMSSELAKLGITVEERADGLTVQGLPDVARLDNPVVVDSHNDHRIAMSLALVGLRRSGVTISDPGVVAKSYPAFWEDLEHLLER